MTEQLDAEQLRPAYLCGRLLAVYESLQYQTYRNEGDVNLTVGDRYYSLASTYPALAFPKIEVLGQKHLRKLRRDRPGAMVALESRIRDLCVDLERAAGYRFPASLDLADQGRFALGYHHQRASDLAQARAAKDRKALEGSGEDENN